MPAPNIDVDQTVAANHHPGHWGGTTYTPADTSWYFKPPLRPPRRFWVPLEFDTDDDAGTDDTPVWGDLVWNGLNAQAFIDAAFDLWLNLDHGPGALRHGDILTGKDEEGTLVEIHIVEDFADPGNFQQARP